MQDGSGDLAMKSRMERPGRALGLGVKPMIKKQAQSESFTIRCHNEKAIEQGDTCTRQPLLSLLINSADVHGNRAVCAVPLQTCLRVGFCCLMPWPTWGLCACDVLRLLQPPIHHLARHHLHSRCIACRVCIAWGNMPRYQAWFATQYHPLFRMSYGMYNFVDRYWLVGSSLISPC